MKNRFVIYDPEQDDHYFCKTDQQMLFDLKEIIDSYKDDGEWIGDPSDIIVAEIKYQIKKKVIAERSKTQIDDDGYDDEGRYWSGHIDDFIDYQIVPINQIESDNDFK
jgi:hypothetical protein